MPTTLHDVARKAGVSHMTVSRVLNRRDMTHVSEETRDRVLCAARAVGYRPNRAAQALVVGGKTHTIAVWVRRLSSPCFANIVQKLEEIIWPDGFESIVRGFGADRTNLAEWPVDGTIVVANAHVDAKVDGGDETSGSPIVCIGAYVDHRFDCVYVNLEPASRQAVSHLAAQGCRRIAHVLKANAVNAADPRLAGYRSGMLAEGLADEVIEIEDDTRQAVAQPLRKWISRNGCPDGFFCRNDEIAIGVYRLVRDLGLRVPEDVCIVGCDGIPELEYFDTPISTIESPNEAMCRKGWQFLKERIADPEAARQSEQMTAELVIRKSSSRR